MTKRRRFVFEALEPRLVLDSIGLGEISPGGPQWESVIVSLHDDAADPRGIGQVLMAQHGGQLGHVYEHALKGFSAQLPAAAVAALARHPQVRLVEQDIAMQAFSQTLPTGVDRIDAELNIINAKKIGEGKLVDVDIAIIDSGIDIDHPDLNVVGGRRFYTITGGPPRSRGQFQDDRFDDDNGHGTHVAGIAGAGDNDFGVVGVAPGANLWAVKVLDANATGYVSDIIAGIEWVTANADTIEVANMSLGGQGKSDAYRTAIQNSVAAGIVYVVAAGNDWGDIHGTDKTFNTADDIIPAAYPEVATISAFADSDGRPGGLGSDTSWGDYGRDDDWWGPSNLSNADGLDGDYDNSLFLTTNPVTSPGLGIDLMLPGADIYSTYPGGGYATMSGTSMAAPHAAGLAALYIAANGRATNADEVYAIRQALIDGGKSWWDSDYGLFHNWTPDRHQENLGWAGPSIAPPVAVEDSYSVVSGETLVVAAPGVLANDTDANGDPLTAHLDSGPANGSLILLNPDGSFSYTPNTGATSDTFTYHAADNTGLASETVTVSISITQPNNSPSATGMSVSTDEDNAVAITLSGFDAETVELEFAIVSGPSHGSLSTIVSQSGIPGNPNQDTASITYTPHPDYNGPDSFTYRVTDAAGAFAEATVSLTVIAVPDAPVAYDDAVSTQQDVAVEIDVLANDVDVDGDSLSAVIVSPPANGNIAPNTDGTLTYTPAPGFSGSDTFTYRASDGALTSDEATVSITVNSLAAVHIGDLDGSKSLVGRSGKWQASVTALVLDATGSPRPDATVSGTWSGATSGQVSGITGSDGSVTLTTPSLSGGVSVTFTVGNVSYLDYLYNSAGNTDPDGDSDGITITIYYGSSGSKASQSASLDDMAEELARAYQAEQAQPDAKKAGKTAHSLVDLVMLYGV